jgi:hypothetical protein
MVTLKVQVPFAAIEPAVNAMVRVAAVVVRLLVPLQADAVELAIDSPDGKTSVNATPVKVVEVLGLDIVKLNEVVFPVRTKVAPNDLAMTGGAITERLDTP